MKVTLVGWSDLPVHFLAVRGWPFKDSFERKLARNLDLQFRMDIETDITAAVMHGASGNDADYTDNEINKDSRAFNPKCS
jgi:hypothetical protein